MISLREFQERFIHSVQGRGNTILDYIAPGGKLTREDSISVYSSDYYARLQDALGENYEAVWAVVGDEEFYSLGQKYIRSHPSTLKDLTSYGNKFHDFLSKLEISKDYPFLVELAKFETEFWSVFHSKRESYIVNWQNYLEHFSGLSFNFSNNFKIFSWDYQVYGVFECRSTGFGDISLDIEKPQSVMLYKKGKNNIVQEISQKSFSIIKCLMDGECLEQIIENTEIEIDESDIQTTFSLLQQSESFFPREKE